MREPTASQLLVTRTRTRTNTNPNDTEANAAGRSVRACVALEVLLDYVVLAYSTGTTGFFITGHSRYCLTRFCLLDLS